MFTKLQVSAIFLGLLFESTSAGPAPQKRADICGSKGYDRGNGNYYYSDSTKLATYAACSQKCVADSKCKSFGYSNSECMLFSVALSENFDANSGSSDTYYDRGCITSTSSSASASASYSSSSSSSSKTTSSSAKATTLSTTIKITVTSTTKTTAPNTSATSTSASKPSSSTTKSAASASVTVPAGCSVPSPISITSFAWFNSTHNLDCANPNYPSTAQVCWNSTSVCPDGDASCTCTPYCYTGLPSYAYQPLGFGPADTISIALDGATPFTGANPQSVRRFEVGQGHFDSGGGADYIGFYGDSNKDTGNNGSVYYNAYGATCNGLVARYTASFPLTCSHDAGNNATCTISTPQPLTFNGYS